MTPPSSLVLNSTFCQTPTVRRSRLPPLLWIHSQDAIARGIADGDGVRVYNDLGELSMTAKVTDAVRPGLCLAESNYAASDFKEGVSLNALCHADPVAPAGGPALHDNRVEVERV